MPRGPSAPMTVHAPTYVGTASGSAVTTVQKRRAGISVRTVSQATGSEIATAEAVVGQMYVAIVIARIVALQIAAGGDQGAARPEGDEPPA